ncbi:hypothetical protein RvY_19438 [Ramazzottius varieornatus]|uniref:Uncharacterized protein n=3 Tax=Ramazzottius varieornatus TaxID=947166 RepID=A0A1D1WB41_RAMVA|nr:hypothetical protein RvY_19438 [Ramazzottius varieornatus]
MSESEESDEETDEQQDTKRGTKVSRLDLWTEFERSAEYWPKSKHRKATCKHCVEAGVKVVKPIRGDRPRLLQHLKTCANVPRVVRERHFPKNDESKKRKSATDTLADDANKRTKSQASLRTFLDRPLTSSEQQQFEELYGDACVSCNIPFAASEDTRMVRLLKFLRPQLVIPSRFTVARRIVPARIKEATAEVSSKLIGQKYLTMTFDGYKNVSRDKVLGFLVTVRNENGTENFTLGSAIDITGMNYDGEYVMRETLQKLTEVKKDYKADVRFVTCDSDGAHRKARRLLSQKLPHIIFLPCSAHQINLVIQDVAKFVPRFKETLRQNDCITTWFRKSSLSQGKLEAVQLEYYSKMYGVKYSANLGLVPFNLKVILDDDEFWLGAKEIAAVLRPLVSAQAKAESDNCTIADIGSAIRDIYCGFSLLKDRDVSWTLVSQLEKRWKSFYPTDVFAVAMFLDPKLKLDMFRRDPKKVHSGVIYTWASDLYRQFFQKDPTSLLTSAIRYTANQGVFDLKYTSQLSNPFDYWTYAEAEHSELAQLAKFLLSACPHAASVERFWKKMNDVHTASRNRLGLNLVSGMCTLKMKFCREDEELSRKRKREKDEKKAKMTGNVSDEPVVVVTVDEETIPVKLDQGGGETDLMELESQMAILDDLFGQDDNDMPSSEELEDDVSLTGKFFTLADLFVVK